MVRSLNVATPDAAALVGVPPSVPDPGFVPIATVTLPLNVVTVLPAASCAVTTTAGAMATPATPLLGSCVNTSCATGPTAISNVLLVPGVSAPEVAVSV